MSELKKRKTPRCQGFDYNSVGAYFITICTHDRRCVLSHIVGTGVPDDSCRYNDEPNVVGTGVLDCPRPCPRPTRDQSTIAETGVLDCPRPHPQTNNVHLELTTYGEIADKYIRQLNDFYDHLSIEDYVIMPNHIHLLLCVKENMCGGMSEKGQSGTPVPTNIERANSACSRFVSTFKRFCNKEYGGNIWQARFNDHIIRNCDDYDRHMNYIRENPIRWYCDELYTVDQKV